MTHCGVEKAKKLNSLLVASLTAVLYLSLSLVPFLQLLVYTRLMAVLCLSLSLVSFLQLLVYQYTFEKTGDDS